MDTTRAVRAVRAPAVRVAPRRLRSPLVWFGLAAVVFFAVPFVGSDLIQLQPDIYYLAYFTVALAFLGAFARNRWFALRPLLRRHALPSCLVGAGVGAATVAQILSQTSTPHPGGGRFIFQLVWRGVVYGSVDALTLYVFPAAVAYLVLHGDRRGMKRKSAFGGLALLLSLVVGTTYHLGYTDYRDRDIRFPELGAVVFNVPTLLTGNPLGSVVAHVAAHTATVVHQHDGGPNHMLPPRVTSDYLGRGHQGPAAAVIVTGWLLATGFVLALAARRPRHGRGEGR